MEGPASVTCLRPCYIRDHKPLCFAESPSELGQSHLSRDCSCCRRMMKRRRSNSLSACTLPIIPEYPGFQDIKLSRNYLEAPSFNRLFQALERGKSSSAVLKSFPNKASLAQCLGSSPRGCLKGHPTASTGFHDKPLQEYFNERLMELRNYESKRSNRKTKGFADKSQNPFLPRRGPRRRSSCSAVVMMGHSKDGTEPCSSAHQDNTNLLQHHDREDSQDVLGLCKADFLDILTMHITAPLEAFVQKK